MDNKIIAIIVVAVLVIAGVGVFIALGNNGGNDGASGLSIVGRVNSEGSGIILKPGEDATEYITETLEQPSLGAKYIKNESTGIYYVFNTSKWGGQVFATPGTATIQHVQLFTLASIMGLKYASYTDGMSLSDDTLYYVAGVASFAEFENKTSSSPLVGYIIWEAQYSVGLEKDYVGLALTNDLFEGHTCCIIGVSNNYLKNNEETVVTFLSVYLQAVNRIDAALLDPTSDDFEKLINIAKNRVAMPDGLTDEEKEEVIMSALYNVTYIYADDNFGSLTKLKADIASLAESLYDTNQIANSASDLGFKSYTELADKFVDDTYMKKAVKVDDAKLANSTTITVAAINGDIHQIALWFAKDTGMFSAANLNVDVSGQSNGTGVYTVLANGEANMGFLGAPPMTIRCMNAEDIHA